MANKNQEIKKQTVDIIITTAENIKYRNQFDDNISFQVVPIRIEWTENARITSRVIRSKNISEIFTGIGDQNLILIPGLVIHIPVIISGAINMYGNPPNGNTGNNF